MRLLRWPHCFAGRTHARSELSRIRSGIRRDLVRLSRQTVDYVLFSDSAVRAATNNRQWYVTISRGRRGIRIFTPDKAGLRENILRSGDSPLALDLVSASRSLRANRINTPWRHWTRGWEPRVRNWLSRVQAMRRNTPAETMMYGHQTT